MDKLEKALLKARDERQRVLAPPAPMMRQPTSVPAPMGEALAAAAAPARPTVPALHSAPAKIADQVLERNRIVARRARNAEADIFRMLRTKVMQVMARSNMKTIAITSANYGDGKTTIAVNLALSIAMDVKQTVLLVDLDLRNPRVHHYLGLDASAGLSDYFVNDTPVPQCLVKPAIDRFSVLPISKPIENSSEMLGSPKMAALATELKTRYSDRIVIYDMPPLLAQDDAIAFLPHVDGVLLVVRDGVTEIDEVNHCLHQLSDSVLIGTVLNDCAETAFNKM